MSGGVLLGGGGGGCRRILKAFKIKFLYTHTVEWRRLRIIYRAALNYGVICLVAIRAVMGVL